MEISHPGVILGTPGYMSPEQVRGEPTDARSDLFSFGVVLYEMVCGKRAFGGGSSIEVMNAILKDDPPPLPASVPPALARLVGHCLEKAPERRFQSATDLAFALTSTLAPPVVVGPRRGSWRKPAFAVAMAVAVLAAAAVFWVSRKRGSLPTARGCITRRTPPESRYSRCLSPVESP